MSRMRMTTERVLGCLALSLAWLVSAPADATVMIEVPMERLVAESDLVVHGRVRSVGTRLAPNAEGHLEPHTISVVSTLEVLAGVPRGSELVIDELGGEVQGRAMRIAGTPEYRRDEEVVVFLRALPDGSYRTYAMAQGAFEVLPSLVGAERVVVRDTRAISMVRWASNGSMQLDHGARREMPLRVFLDYLRGLDALLDDGGAR
jgi:hypothetical protein